MTKDDCMKLKLENCNKKIDRAGRIVIPKHIRYKGEISDEATLSFFTVQSDDGRMFVAVSEALPEELEAMGNYDADQKYRDAIAVLEELGEPIPESLDKYNLVIEG
jgi:bifunctional DNA-binding transcriptional regulator/antitoxin component of YhaV-PrlF toxin-antitoxin module